MFNELKEMVSEELMKSFNKEIVSVSINIQKLWKDKSYSWKVQ